jgi:hypothetical protein
MEKYIKEILKGLKLNKGVSENQLDILQDTLGVSLPDDYLEFLRYTDGALGLIANDCYIAIWDVKEIASFNENYTVDEFVPGLLVFASDGGDRAYAFDTRSDKLPVVEYSFSELSLDEAKPISSTFNEFLKSYCQT